MSEVVGWSRVAGIALAVILTGLLSGFSTSHATASSVHEDATLAAGSGDASLDSSDLLRPDAESARISWTRQTGAVADDVALDATSDASSLYVTGKTSGSLASQPYAGSDDAFLTKNDFAGARIWTRELGSLGADTGSAVSVGAGGVYIGGWTDGTLPGQANVGFEDTFVAKYDANGVFLWVREFGSTSSETVRGIYAASSGVYVVGSTGGTIPGATSSGGYDPFVRKYDASGNVVWTRQFGSLPTGSYDEGRGVWGDATGIYVVGFVDGALPGQSDLGNFDGFVRKYDFNGNTVWTRQFGTSTFDVAWDVFADSSGVYIQGMTYGAGGSSETDAVIWKYDSNGNPGVLSQFGTSSSEFPSAISVNGTTLYAVGYTAGTFAGQTSAGGYDVYLRRCTTAVVSCSIRQFGSSSDDFGSGVAAAADGAFVAGSLTGTLPGQLSAGGSADAFVRKVASDGSEVWTQQFGGLVNDEGRAIVTTSTGLFVTGETTGTLAGQTSAGGWDGYLMRFDGEGNRIWTREFGSPGFDQSLALATDGTAVYVAGWTDNILPGQTSAGSSDAFVRKYDVLGNAVWTRQFGTTASDLGWAVAADSTGVYVAGGTSGAFPGQTNSGSVDAFLRKYDPNGNLLWTREFGTAAQDDGYGVVAHSSGVYLAGRTYGALPGQSSAGGPDAFVRKYSANGIEMWTRQFGSSQFDQASAVVGDSTGVYVAGQTNGVLPGQTSAGGADAFVRKYDFAGNTAWTRQFGTSARDDAVGIASDGRGVSVAGSTIGAFPDQTSSGGTDAFLRRYDPDGTVLWTMQFGTSATDTARAVAAGASTLYVTGDTYGAMENAANPSGSDLYVASVALNQLPAFGPFDTSPASPIPGQPVRITIQVSDADGDALAINWSFGDGSGQTDSTPPGGGTVSADHVYGSAGTYTVRVTADDGRGGVTSALVDVTVVAPGLLRVTTSPALPGKIIVDGVPRDEWGLTWVKIAPGSHTVSFGGLNGLGTPADQTVTVTAGVTTEAQGNYAPYGYLRVITNPPVVSTISVNGVPRDDYGMWTAFAPGTYTVHFGAVAGYDPPADQSATVVAGQTTTITGDFATNLSAPGPDPSTFGYLRVTTNPATPAQILVDGIPRDDWGLTWVKLPPGTYTVWFGQGYGYTPPAPKTVTVSAGATAVYDAPFVVHGSLRVTTTNAPLPPTIFVDGLPRDDWGMWQSMPPGAYKISFGPVPGTSTPLPTLATVVSDRLIVCTGDYQTGSTTCGSSSTLGSAKVPGGLSGGAALVPTRMTPPESGSPKAPVSRVSGIPGHDPEAVQVVPGPALIVAVALAIRGCKVPRRRSPRPLGDGLRPAA